MDQAPLGDHQDSLNNELRQGFMELKSAVDQVIKEERQNARKHHKLFTLPSRVSYSGVGNETRISVNESPKEKASVPILNGSFSGKDPNSSIQRLARQCLSPLETLRTENDLKRTPLMHVKHTASKSSLSSSNSPRKSPKNYEENQTDFVFKMPRHLKERRTSSAFTSTPKHTLLKLDTIPFTIPLSPMNNSLRSQKNSSYDNIAQKLNFLTDQQYKTKTKKSPKVNIIAQHIVKPCSNITKESAIENSIAKQQSSNRRVSFHPKITNKDNAKRCEPVLELYDAGQQEEIVQPMTDTRRSQGTVKRQLAFSERRTSVSSSSDDNEIPIKFKNSRYVSKITKKSTINKSRKKDITKIKSRCTMHSCRRMQLPDASDPSATFNKMCTVCLDHSKVDADSLAYVFRSIMNGHRRNCTSRTRVTLADRSMQTTFGERDRASAPSALNYEDDSDEEEEIGGSERKCSLKRNLSRETSRDTNKSVQENKSKVKRRSLAEALERCRKQSVTCVNSTAVNTSQKDAKHFPNDKVNASIQTCFDTDDGLQTEAVSFTTVPELPIMTDVNGDVLNVKERTLQECNSFVETCGNNTVAERSLSMNAEIASENECLRENIENIEKTKRLRVVLKRLDVSKYIRKRRSSPRKSKSNSVLRAQADVKRVRRGSKRLAEQSQSPVLSENGVRRSGRTRKTTTQYFRIVHETKNSRIRKGTSNDAESNSLPSKNSTKTKVMKKQRKTSKKKAQVPEPLGEEVEFEDPPATEMLAETSPKSTWICLYQQEIARSMSAFHLTLKPGAIKNLNLSSDNLVVTGLKGSGHILQRGKKTKITEKSLHSLKSGAGMKVVNNSKVEQLSISFLRMVK